MTDDPKTASDAVTERAIAESAAAEVDENEPTFGPWGQAMQRLGGHAVLDDD